jgi:hypothetical protein
MTKLKPAEKFLNYKEGAELLGIDFNTVQGDVIDQIKEEDGIDFSILLKGKKNKTANKKETVVNTIRKEKPVIVKEEVEEEQEAEEVEEETEKVPQGPDDLYMKLNLGALLEKRNCSFSGMATLAEIYINRYNLFHDKNTVLPKKLKPFWEEITSSRKVPAKYIGILFGYEHDKTKNSKSEGPNASKYAFSILRDLELVYLQPFTGKNSCEYSVNLPVKGFEQITSQTYPGIFGKRKLNWDKEEIYLICAKALETQG